MKVIKLMLENTLQLSLWRHVLNFIIVSKTLSTLFISTIIIIIIVQHCWTSTTLGFPKLWTAQPTCSRASPLMIVSSLSHWSALSACTFISSSWHIFISQKSVTLWLPFVFSFLCKQWTLHHFIILPIFYFPRQDGGGGRLPIFVLVKKGGCQKILYDLVGLILKHFALLKNILYPPPHLLLYT